VPNQRGSVPRGVRSAIADIEATMDRVFKKPPVRDVHGLLRKRNGLIVHFSGAPGAGNTPIRYPVDLRNVISGVAMSGVACSVVTPGDTFIGAGQRNAYGTIGVILDLRDEQSLATATPGDGGSIWTGEGTRDFDEKDLSIEDLEASLKKRDGHNEWGIRNYIVRGLFVIDPAEIWGSVKHKHGVIDGIIPYSLARVREDFPEQRIYSFADGGIVEEHPRGHKTPGTHGEIYR
jgi:hypothetical protein